MADRSPGRLDWTGADGWQGSRAPSPDPSSHAASAAGGSPRGGPRTLASPPDLAGGYGAGAYGLVPLAAAGSGCGSPRGSPGGYYEDAEMAAHTRWVGVGVEQKLTALSRRTAAEFKRAEKERGDLWRRLDSLEQLCRQHLGSLDVRLGHCREEALAEAEKAAQRACSRLERDMQQLSEALQQERSRDINASEERTAEALRSLARRAEHDRAALEELRSWRREAEQRLAACGDAGGGASHSGGSEELADSLAGRLEEQLEAAIARERRQAHERLRSSCAEVTGHLNELRLELVEQRRALDACADRLEQRRERAHGELAAQVADLESQLAELGGALAGRIQAKLASLGKEFGAKAEGKEEEEVRLRQRLDALEQRAATLEGQRSWAEPAPEEPLGVGAAGQALALEELRDEARTVHAEVMSVDTRLAAVEEWMVARERLAEGPSQQRLDALFREADRPPLAGAGLRGHGWR